MAVLMRPVRLFLDAQKTRGVNWLSDSYYIEELQEEELTKIDEMYKNIRETGAYSKYIADYLKAVPLVSLDHYTNRKYVIKTSEGELMGYVGLKSDKTTVMNFIHLPLVAPYDPMITLLVKLWLYHHPDFDKVYYTMRYGFIKKPPMDDFLNIINIGRVNPNMPDELAMHTYYMKTKKGGVNVQME
ncbi:hypothetical protein ACEZNB_001152 [Vibrio parahaemolyticus]